LIKERLKKRLAKNTQSLQAMNGKACSGFIFLFGTSKANSLGTSKANSWVPLKPIVVPLKPIVGTSKANSRVPQKPIPLFFNN